MTVFSNTIRIQLIEEVPINEAGMCCLLKKQPDFQVLEHIQCKQECRLPCLKPLPDVLLLVVNFGSQCGLECSQQIIRRNSGIKILVLCMIQDPHLAKRFMELGVKGIIWGRTPPEILFRAIRKIAGGESYIDTEIAKMMVTPHMNHEINPFSSLSHREYEIVGLMLNGLNQQEIGIKLYISPHTVANHHVHIMKKLDINNHIELTKLAIRHKLTTA